MKFSSKITICLIVLMTIYNNIIIKSWAQFESTNDSLVIDLSDNNSSTHSSTESEETSNETIDKNWTQTIIITKTTESEVIPNSSSTDCPLIKPEEESVKFGPYFGVSLLVCAFLAFLAMVWFVCRAFVQSLDE
jgi:hypothetical protein